MKTCSPILSLLCVLLLAATALAQPPLPPEISSLPRFSRATAMATMSMDNTVNASFEAAGTPSEVIDFFNAQLAGQGWQKNMEARQDDGAMASYSKDNQGLTVGVSREDEGKVTYTLLLSK